MTNSGLVYRADFTVEFQFYKGKGPLIDMANDARSILKILIEYH